MKTFRSLVALQAAIILTLISACIITSCSDDDTTTGPTPPAATGPVEVATINPSAGPKTTLVTIAGTNFSTSLTENTITFNGKPATVVTATATQLTVTVPPTADSGPVVVTTKGKSATNQPMFTFYWTVSTLAGSSKGHENGAEPKFNAPSGVAADATGNVFVTDFENHVIRKITRAGTVSTAAGSTYGVVNGPAATSQFLFPNGCAVDKQGNIYISEERSHLIRKITPEGEVSTFAGNDDMRVRPWGDSVTYGYIDGPATKAKFWNPSGIAIDNHGNLFVADQYNNCIRKISPAGEVSTLAGGKIGSEDIESSAGTADGIGTAARFYRPVGVVADAEGNVYVGDLFNHRIRKITASGVVTTLAGSSYGFNNGPGKDALFAFPAGLALDKQGNLYVADTENDRIRKITPTGVVSTFAGTASQGTANGIATSADFFLPREIDIDSEGNMYVADAGNHRIRKID